MPPFRFGFKKFPRNGELKEATGLPWGATLQPFCPWNSPSAPSPSEVARCQNCFGYINPHASFYANKWHCPLCRSASKMPERYEDSQKNASLPELSQDDIVYVMDTVSVAAGDLKDGSMPLSSQRPVYLACVDTNCSASALSAIRDALLAIIETLHPLALFGMIAFDSHLRAFDLCHHRSRPHVVSTRISSSSSSHVPLHELLPLKNIFVPISEYTNTIITAIDYLVDSAAGSVPPRGGGYLNGLGSVLSDIFDCLSREKNDSADEVIKGDFVMQVYGETSPNLGVGQVGASEMPRGANERENEIVSISKTSDSLPIAMTHKDAPTRPVDEDEELETLNLLPKTEFYRDIGQKAAEFNVCIDVIWFSSGLTNQALPSVKFLALLTGGRVLHYQMDNETTCTLPQDIFRRFSGRRAHDGLMRIRTSPEFAISHVYGSLHPVCCVLLTPNQEMDPAFENLYHIPSVEENTTYALDFEFTSLSGFDDIDATEGDETAVIQLAFAFSVIGGDESELTITRCLRVETCQLSLSYSVRQLYDSMDPDVAFVLLTHKMIRATLDEGVKETRLMIRDWVIILMTKYNDATQAAAYTGMMDAHNLDLGFSDYPSLQYLTRLVFGLLKHDLLVTSVIPNRRIFLQMLCQSLSPRFLLRFIYPLLSSFDDDGNDQLHPRLVLSQKAVLSAGTPFFLIDSLDCLFVYCTVPLPGSSLPTSLPPPPLAQPPVHALPPKASDTTQPPFGLENPSNGGDALASAASLVPDVEQETESATPEVVVPQSVPESPVDTVTWPPARHSLLRKEMNELKNDGRPITARVVYSRGNPAEFESQLIEEVNARGTSYIQFLESVGGEVIKAYRDSA